MNRTNRNEPLITRHRPITFADMVGMQETIGGLEQAIAGNNLPNAYLLLGSTGCGKTTLARVIARAAMCELGTACGECASCQTTTGRMENHPDYTEINCGVDGKVDDIRNLLRSANNLPMIGRFRVIVLDEVHRLTGASMEAMLKPLEEPAATTLWILATTEIGAIKDSIRNRCNVIPVHPADIEELGKYLGRIAYKELKSNGISVPKALHANINAMGLSVADKSNGYIRQSLSYLDMIVNQIVAESQGDKDIAEILEAESVENIIGGAILDSMDDSIVDAHTIIKNLLLGGVSKAVNGVMVSQDPTRLALGLLHVSNYFVSKCVGVRRSEYYNPMSDKLWSSLSESKPELVKLGSCLTLLEGMVDAVTEVKRYAVPEKSVLAAHLYKIAKNLRREVK